MLGREGDIVRGVSDIIKKGRKLNPTQYLSITVKIKQLGKQLNRERRRDP